MSDTVEIANQSQDGHIYRIEMVTNQTRRLANFLEAQLTPDCSWAEFVAVVLEKGRPFFTEVSLFKDGALNDGPNGEPAFQSREDTILHTMRFVDGKRNDAPDGSPAMQETIISTGVVIQTARYKGDYLNDGPKGEPAVRVFDESGSLTYVEHRQHERLNDTASGTAAMQWWEKGKMVNAHHYTDDVLTNKLLDEEARPAVKKQPKQPAPG